MDALQWMGAVRMRVQTADKNITMIHKVTPVHQLTSCDIKIFMFVIIKSIIKAFFTLNHHFWIKYEYIIHNLLLSSHIKIHPHVCLEVLWTVFAWNGLICAYFSPDADETSLSLEKQYFNQRSRILEIRLYDGFVSYKNWSKSIQMKKEAHLDIGWPEGEHIFIFGWTIPLNKLSKKY